jgi:hypothetical protein
MGGFDHSLQNDYDSMTMVTGPVQMHTEVSKSKFKAHALEIFRHVETTGEAVVVTDHGAPAVIVRKYTGTVADVRARLKGSVLRYDDPFAPVADADWDALA